MELITTNVCGLLREVDGMQQGSDRGTIPLLHGGESDHYNFIVLSPRWVEPGGVQGRRKGAGRCTCALGNVIPA